MTSNCFFECIAIGWCYGADNFLTDVTTMTGEKCGSYLRTYYVVCWKYITPILNIILFIVAVVRSEPLKYER
jgi:SNF family Na+-dependent transporter